MNRLASLALAAVSAVTLVLAPVRAGAADRPALTLDNRGAHLRGAAARYWTAERLTRARPTTPAVSALPLASVAAPQAAGTPAAWAARGPSVPVAPDMTNRIYDPADAVVDDDADVEPANSGTLEAHFTSSRIIGAQIHTKFPYSTVGQLFFTQPGIGDFVCSAAVIARRVVVTAGHCVHRGSGGQSGFHTNFQFVPAPKNGVAPFGTWSWAYAAVTGAWAAGGGGVPNAADYAMIELQDQPGGVRVGDVTGSLGWQTLRLIPNHATLLGYPCNLDQCQQMHQITAGSFRSTSPNNVEYGSDARGGQSGGPWIQNFGKKASGQPTGANAGANQVVGVVSYGYVATGPKAQGGSIPDSRWSDLFNTVCAHRAGNC
jgi:V8-like Glu-specific endopeptidase